MSPVEAFATTIKFFWLAKCAWSSPSEALDRWFRRVKHQIAAMRSWLLICSRSEVLDQTPSVPQYRSLSELANGGRVWRLRTTACERLAGTQLLNQSRVKHTIIHRSRLLDSCCQCYLPSYWGCLSNDRIWFRRHLRRAKVHRSTK